MSFDLAEWSPRFREVWARECDAKDDPAHDEAHLRRVVATAMDLGREERAALRVVLPAAWFHDLVNVPKNDPRRSQASRLSATRALACLREMNYPVSVSELESIGHAIEAHSFSAKIEPRTLEARVVQDADRLDGLGAIGIGRLFIVGGLLKRRIYDPADPFAETRTADDLVNTIDHFYVKLFKVADSLQTEAGRAEGARRARFMREYLEQLRREIHHA